MGLTPNPTRDPVGRALAAAAVSTVEAVEFTTTLLHQLAVAKWNQHQAAIEWIEHTLGQWLAVCEAGPAFALTSVERDVWRQAFEWELWTAFAGPRPPSECSLQAIVDAIQAAMVNREISVAKVPTDPAADLRQQQPGETVGTLSHDWLTLLSPQLEHAGTHAPAPLTVALGRPGSYLALIPRAAWSTLPCTIRIQVGHARVDLKPDDDTFRAAAVIVMGLHVAGVRWRAKDRKRYEALQVPLLEYLSAVLRGVGTPKMLIELLTGRLARLSGVSPDQLGMPEAIRQLLLLN